MYCICNKISFKDILSLVNDYGFSIEELEKRGIAGNKCKLCVPHLEKEIKVFNFSRINMIIRENR